MKHIYLTKHRRIVCAVELTLVYIMTLTCSRHKRFVNLAVQY